MSPHEEGEEFVLRYIAIMQGDKEITNFQRILEMKVGVVKGCGQWNIIDCARLSEY